MEEGNISELTAPLGSYTYTTEKSHHLVAAAFKEGEAEIRSFPNTFYTVSALWFCYSIFKLALQRRRQEALTLNVHIP